MLRFKVVNYNNKIKKELIKVKQDIKMFRIKNYIYIFNNLTVQEMEIIQAKLKLYNTTLESPKK